MSRSALWHQEKNHQQRQLKAEEIYNKVVEEGREKTLRNAGKKNYLLPLRGQDDSSFHINPMLLQNIIHSPYFVKICESDHDWNTLVDEIYYHVKHLEPWNLGIKTSAAANSKMPSTAFCLLLRLLTMRVTEKQMKLMLQHEDSPYIRGIGFLYLRYGCEPSILWEWIQPYLFDMEPIQVQVLSRVPSPDNNNSRPNKRSNATTNNDNNSIQTIGDYVRFLFTTRDYFGTVLPRLPIPIEREIAVNVLQATKINQRAKEHFANKKRMQYFYTIGSPIIGLYGDDENPIRWYNAVIDRIIYPSSSSSLNSTSTTTTNSLPTSSVASSAASVLNTTFPSFVVTFPEYGNTETVSLGEIDVPPVDGILPQYSGSTSQTAENSRSKYDYNDRYNGTDGGRRPRYNDNDYHGGRGNDFDRRKRRDDYNRGGGMPAAHIAEDLYEEVLQKERDNVTTNGRDFASRRPPSTKTSLAAPSSYNDTGSRDRRYNQHRNSSSSSPSRKISPSNNNNNSNNNSNNKELPRKRTAEQTYADQEKKRKLMAKYG